MTTCVRSRYGPRALKLVAFLGNRARGLRYSGKPFRSPSRPRLVRRGFACAAAEPLGPESVNRIPLPVPSPRSHARGGRNIDRHSIGCACRPRLRTRLTPGGRPFPGKPQSNGGGDSHPSSLLTPAYSLPCGPAVLTVRLRPAWDAPLPQIASSANSAQRLSPGESSVRGRSTSELLRTL